MGSDDVVSVHYCDFELWGKGDWTPWNRDEIVVLYPG